MSVHSTIPPAQPIDLLSSISCNVLSKESDSGELEPFRLPRTVLGPFSTVRPTSSQHQDASAEQREELSGTLRNIISYPGPPALKAYFPGSEYLDYDISVARDSKKPVVEPPEVGVTVQNKPLGSPNESNGEQQQTRTGGHTDGSFAPLLHALRTNDTVRIESLVSKYFSADEALQESSPSVFHEILRVARPSLRLRKLNEYYKHLSDADLQKARLRHIKITWTEANDLTMKLVSLREGAAHTLSPHEYGWLFEAETGLDELTNQLLMQMRRGHIQPSRASFNAVLKQYGVTAPAPEQRARLRHTNFNVRLPYMGLSARSEDRNQLPEGYSGSAAHVLSEMERYQIKPDEETYRALMLVYAREGNIGGINSILATTWNISLNDASATDELEPKQGIIGSRLEPTAKLLWTIAHCFGTNNDVPTALQLIDIASKQYGIEIDESTWTELLDWTYVLSARPKGVESQIEKSAGQLPWGTVHDVARLISTEPYSAKLTIVNLKKLMARAKQQRDLGKAQIIAEQEKQILEESRAVASRSMTKLAMLRALHDAHPGESLSRLIRKQDAQWQADELIRIRNHWMVRRAASQMAYIHTQGMKADPSFATMDLLKEWGSYLRACELSRLTGHLYGNDSIKKNADLILHVKTRRR